MPVALFANCLVYYFLDEIYGRVRLKEFLSSGNTADQLKIGHVFKVIDVYVSLKYSLSKTADLR